MDIYFIGRKVTCGDTRHNQVKDLLEGVGTVLSTLLAIVLCIMSVYIISTALVLLMGGGGI